MLRHPTSVEDSSTGKWVDDGAKLMDFPIRISPERLRTQVKRKVSFVLYAVCRMRGHEMGYTASDDPVVGPPPKNLYYSLKLINSDSNEASTGRSFPLSTNKTGYPQDHLGWVSYSSDMHPDIFQIFLEWWGKKKSDLI